MEEEDSDMQGVTQVLAGIPSADLTAAREWWTSLFGREPDAEPMPTDLEWHVEGGGGVQVIEAADRAGSGSVTLGVDDVDAVLAALKERGMEVPEAQTVPSGQFRIAQLTDPDGNSVVLGQVVQD